MDTVIFICVIYIPTLKITYLFSHSLYYILWPQKFRYSNEWLYKITKLTTKCGACPLVINCIKQTKEGLKL